MASVDMAASYSRRRGGSGAKNLQTAIRGRNPLRFQGRLGELRLVLTRVCAYLEQQVRHLPPQEVQMVSRSVQMELSVTKRRLTRHSSTSIDL